MIIGPADSRPFGVMYIDILLGFVFVLGIYILWCRISEKIPDLKLIPDQDMSVLLEENTAKIQRFFLHLFHFRSFYRERHYHAKFWSVVTKLLFKFHIILLRADNGIMRLMKRMRASNEMEVEQRHDTKEYFSQLQDHPSSSSTPEKTNRMQEVRTRKRARLTRNLNEGKIEATEIKLINNRRLP